MHEKMQKATLCVLQLKLHIIDLRSFKYGSVEGKNPLNENLQQGFRQ